MQVTLTYEVEDSWVEYQGFTQEQLRNNLAGYARKGFDLCLGGVGTRGTDFIKLLPNKKEEEKE